MMIFQKTQPNIFYVYALPTCSTILINPSIFLLASLIFLLISINFTTLLLEKQSKGAPNNLVALQSCLGCILCRQSRINSKKRSAFTTSHKLKVGYKVINSANGDMTLKEQLNCFLGDGNHRY